MAVGGDLSDVVALRQFPLTITPRYFVYAAESGDGHFQSIQYAEPGVVDIHVVFDKQYKEEIAALRAFVDENGGPYSAFTWTDDRAGFGQTYNVRLDPAHIPEYVSSTPNVHAVDLYLIGIRVD